MNEVIDHLRAAVENGRTDIVRSLLSTVASSGTGSESVNLSTILGTLMPNGGTVLHYAVKCDQKDSVQTLLSAGADPCIQNADGKTPLDLVSSDKMREAFHQELLQCVAKSNTGRVCQLLAAGVSVNLHDSPYSLNTPLHWAASYSSLQVVHCLCKRGASINATNADGMTPLHDAVLRRDVGIFEELLSAGASLDVCAKSGKHRGKTPLDLAETIPEIMSAVESNLSRRAHSGVAAADEILSINSVMDESPVIGHSKLDEYLNGVSNSGTPIHSLNVQNKSVNNENSITDNDLTLTTATPRGPATDRRLELLWPTPQRILERAGDTKTFKATGKLFVYIDVGPRQEVSYHRVADMWRAWERDFARLSLKLCTEAYSQDGSRYGSQSYVVCRVHGHLFATTDSYRLSVTHRQISLQCSDVAGVHNGIVTLLQLLTVSPDATVPSLQIHDHPSTRDRGALLDFSKGRIPTMDYMKQLVHDMSYLKLNQLQLYTRLNIPHDGEQHWQFPYMHGVLLELDRYCREYCVMLVPVLDVAPHVDIDAVTALYETFRAFLAAFPSTTIVGIGPRLSGFLLAATEEGRVKVHHDRIIPLLPGQMLQLCAFPFHETAETFDFISPDFILAEYGFQANYDFHKSTALFDQSGIPFITVPGTAAWNSLSGCPEATVRNISTAAVCSAERESLGLVVAHWSGAGLVTHLLFAWPGLVTAAGLAWNSRVNMDYLHGHLADLLNVHVLQDKSWITGQVILELGRAETYLLRCARNQTGTDESDLPAENGSTLYHLLSQPDNIPLEHIHLDAIQKVMRHVRKCQMELSRAQLQSEDGAIVQAELQLTADLMLLACRIGRALIRSGQNPTSGLGHNPTSGYAVINAGITNLPATTKTDLANKLLSVVENFRSVWMLRSLPEGLTQSVHPLLELFRHCVPSSKSTAAIL